MKRAMLAFAALAAAGCNQGNPVAPDPGLVVNVVADPGTDTPALRSAFEVIQARFRGRIAFVRDGSGTRTIHVKIDPSRMWVTDAGYRVNIFANPFACTCVAEGEIVMRIDEIAQFRRTLLHEIGHLFGLGHHTRPGIMGSGGEDMLPTEEEWQRMDAALAADSDAAGGGLQDW